MSPVGFYQGCDTHIVAGGSSNSIWAVGMANGIFGSRTLLAGGTSGYADGTGAAARFNNPDTVIVSPDGSFALIGEYGQCGLRKIFLSNQTVVTVAGRADQCTTTDGVGSNARFSRILTLAYIPSSGSLYVIGEESTKVRLYNDTSGSVTTIATMPSTASGIAATATTAYVSCAATSSVYAINLKTYATSLWLMVSGSMYGKIGLSADNTRAVVPVYGTPDKLLIVDMATKATIATIPDSGNAFGGLGFQTSPLYSPDGAYIYLWTHAACVLIIDTTNYVINKTCTGVTGYGEMAYVPATACPSKTATPFCASCPASQYCPAVKIDCPDCACMSCPANKYYISNIQCGVCPARSTSPMGTGSIGGCTCNDGTYVVNNNTADQQCLTCLPGFYCQGGVSTPCPANSYCVEGSATPAACPALSTAPLYSNASTACECGNGYYMSGGVCSLCGYGTYGAKGTVGACKACPVNSTTASQGAYLLSQCLCVPGFTGDALVQINSSACSVCPTNSYCPGNKANNTIVCPNSTFSIKGASSKDQCVCPGNSTWLPSTNCTCDNGFYSGPPTPSVCGYICGNGKQCPYTVTTGIDTSYPLSDALSAEQCKGLVTNQLNWAAVIDLGQTFQHRDRFPVRPILEWPALLRVLF